MTRRTRTRALWALGAIGGGALGLSAAPAAQAAPPPYQLVDVGTLGGAQAFLNLPGVPITSDGGVIGATDTAVPDLDYPNFNPFLSDEPDPVLLHAFVWRQGHPSDLGALPGNNGSAVFQMNGNGVGAGISETGTIDTLTGYPAAHAVVFENGVVTDLGTLPGGQESLALAINGRGQVAGFGSNGISDPTSVFGWGTQTRSFIWQDGTMRDLGTLGGPDTVMTTMNARGQIAGDSYTDAVLNPETGTPTTHPFLWSNGRMRDLGTLGGTQSGTNWLNDAGQVVGVSNLAGDQTAHPFLWNGGQLQDMGTLGGDFGVAYHINAAGHVVGWSTPPGNDTVHAFLWRNGVMTDLADSSGPACSFTEGINNRDQVVGASCEGSALMWDDGTQYDLNDLVSTPAVQLTEAVYIDDAGRIVSLGTLADGHQHVFLLVPTGHAPGTNQATAGRREAIDKRQTCLPHLMRVIRQPAPICQ